MLAFNYDFFSLCVNVLCFWICVFKWTVGVFASTFLLKEIWNKGIYFVAMFVVFRNVEIGGYILLLTALFCANIADIVSIV